MDIAASIRMREVLAFTYDGHDRVVQPAALGRHATTDNLVLRAFQVGGSSESGPVPGWRLFLVEGIQGRQPLRETFRGEPPGYRRNDRAMALVYAQL